MLTLTEAATRKIQAVLAEQKDAVYGLRVSVFRGGCSGYEYGMSLAGTPETGDWVGDFQGVRVLVDPESARFLDGVSIDYVESLQASGFRISNPNAASGCGCGRSFQTEEQDAAHATAPAAQQGGCACGRGGCGCGGHEAEV